MKIFNVFGVLFSVVIFLLALYSFLTGGLGIQLHHVLPSRHVVYNGTNATCHFEMPTRNTIIIRVDDIQQFAFDNATIAVVNAILADNMSATLEVIPKGISNDPRITDYLINVSTDPRIEIAQHGTNHTYDEYNSSNLTYNQTYAKLLSGYEQIVNALYVKPKTFAPPNDAYNNNTIIAMQKLGFSIFTGGLGDNNFTSPIPHIAPTVYTRDTEGNDRGTIGNPMVNISTVVSQCQAALQADHLCVILTHVEDFITVRNGNYTALLNQSQFAYFVALLSSLKKLNATHSTFNQLIKCSS